MFPFFRCIYPFINWSQMSENQIYSATKLNNIAWVLKPLGWMVSFFKIEIPEGVETKREDCAVDTVYLQKWDDIFNGWQSYLLELLKNVMIVAGVIVLLALILASCCIICLCGLAIVLIILTSIPCFTICVKSRVKKQRNLEKQRLLQGLLEDKEMESVDNNENNENNLLEKVDMSIFNLNFEDYKIDKDIGEIVFFSY